MDYYLYIYSFHNWLCVKIVGNIIIPREPIDALAYMEIAEYFIGVEGATYILSREPFFSLLLGFVYLIFPNTYLTARLFTTFLGSLNIILIYFVTKKYAQSFGANDNSEKFGFVAALFVCFNDRFILYDGWGLRESLYALLFMILLYSILIEKKVLKRTIYCICSFLLILTKEESLILLLFTTILLFFKDNFSVKTNIKNSNNKNETRITDEGKTVNNKGKSKFGRFFLKLNYNFLFIFLGLIVGYCLWKLLSYILFSDPFATSNDMAKLYFENEFGTIPPESLTTFDYLFKFHKFKDLILAFLQGVPGIMNLYLGIFNLISFAFFIIALVKFVIKRDFIFLFWIIYPVLFLGIFAVLWRLNPYDRILIPYSLIGFISIPIVIYDVVEDFDLKVTSSVNIRMTKIRYFYIISSLIVLYSIGQLFTSFF